jgi:hypothetical protein
MGVAQVLAFAACWVVVVALVLWALLAERRRGRGRSEASAGLGPADWFLVEVAEGASADVARRVRFLANAWLATRGLDLAALPPDAIRTEVTTTGDGESTTRVLLKSAALWASLRHH